MEMVLTAETLLREIYLAETELRWFEQKYGILSEIFYQLYEKGLLRDEDPDEVQTYLEWSGWWEIYQSRRERYTAAIETRLQAISGPASLAELHIDQIAVPN